MRACRGLRLLAGGGILLSVLAAAAGYPASARGEEQSPPAVTMEELSVRGMREKPEQLFLPAPAPISLPSAVRYDLLLEDMTRIVRPWEISRESRMIGGTYEY